MRLSSVRDISAVRSEVWVGLLDADVLRACIPGCTELFGSAEDGFEAVVVQKVGPVKATFRGSVVITDMVAPESCVITGEGKGGPAGFAKGGAQVRLEEIEMEDGAPGTRLHYEVEAKVGGKLAQLGSRIIDGFAKRMADQFFERFQTALEGPGDGDGDVEADDADGDAAPEDKKKGWLKRLVSS